MFIFIKSKFIAAIIRDPIKAGAYLAMMPVGDCVILNEVIEYPFYLIEQTSDQKPFQAVDALAFPPDQGTIYLISNDFEPPEPWTDHMGVLQHIHVIE